MKRLSFIFFLLLSSGALTAQQYFNRTYGGMNHDIGRKIVKDTDSTFFILGNYFGDIYLLKINRTGDTLFTKKYLSNSHEFGSDIVKGPNNELLIIGGGFFSSNIIKADNNGTGFWTKIDSTHGEYAVSSVFLENGHFFTTGRKPRTTISGNDTIGHIDISITEYDEAGDVVWEKYYGNPLDNDLSLQIISTSDSGLVITGSTYIWGHGTQFYLFKVNQTGDTLWTKTLFESSAMCGTEVVENENKELVNIGYKIKHGEDYNVTAIKFDSLGNKLWGKDYHFGYSEIGTSLMKSIGGGYYAIGCINYNDTGMFMVRDIVLLRLKENGDTSWTKIFKMEGDECATSILEIDNNTIAILGTRFSNTVPKSDIYLIICDSLGNYTNTTGIDGINYSSLSNDFSLFPNPSKNTFKLQSATFPIEAIRLYNSCGQEVLSRLNIKSNSIEFEEAFPPGLYFMKVTDSENYSKVIKMVRE